MLGLQQGVRVGESKVTNSRHVYRRHENIYKVWTVGDFKIFRIRKEVRILGVILGYLIGEAVRCWWGRSGIGVSMGRLNRDAKGLPDNVEEST